MRSKRRMRTLIQSMLDKAYEEALIEEIGNLNNTEKRTGLDERKRLYSQEVFAARAQVAFVKPQVMEEILKKNYLRGVNR